MAGSSINKHVSKHVTLPFFFDFWEIEIDQSAQAESHMSNGNHLLENTATTITFLTKILNIVVPLKEGNMSDITS
jgi:hypothetical protein